jgi:hypothetical protein
LHDWQIRGLRAFEDATDINANLTIPIDYVGPIAHQAPDFGVVTQRIRRREVMECRQLCQARPLRPWRGTRRRRGPLRQRSNSRKSPAAMPAAAVERGLPNRLNLARAAIWHGKPRQRALRQRRAAGQRLRALRQQHSPLAWDTIGPRNKM